MQLVYEQPHTFSNRSRTRDAPTPTNSSTNSEAAHEKKGTPASPAMALASSVLPVPAWKRSHSSVAQFQLCHRARGAAAQRAAADTGSRDWVLPRIMYQNTAGRLQESPPGGPTSRQPLGILAPRLVYLSGDFRKSTTSVSSSFAPSQPCSMTAVRVNAEYHMQPHAHRCWLVSGCLKTRGVTPCVACM